MMLNVGGGRWFVEKPYEAQCGSFQKWLTSASGGRLLVIEIGVRHNTPSVIRWPSKAITANIVTLTWSASIRSIQTCGSNWARVQR
jgi:hypothetical protein